MYDTYIHTYIYDKYPEIRLAYNLVFFDKQKGSQSGLRMHFVGFTKRLITVLVLGLEPE